MAGEWRLARLSELGEVNRGRSRHRPRDAAHLYGGPYPFIQTGDIKASNGRIVSYTQTYSEAGLAQSRLWPAKTMCITIAANIAETGILTFPACFPDSVIGFIADENKADVYFIEYAFRLQKRRLQHEATGTVQDNINLQTIERLEIPVPSLIEQRAIAHILGTLDDKIELNRRMNETLEAMTRAIFKSWFVDFDPVRSKASGESPESICRRLRLTPDILALFPDLLVESELREIPVGWERTTLRNLTTKIGSGATPRGGRDVYLEEGVSQIRSQNVYDSNFVWEGLAHISDEAAEQLAGVEVRTDDVLINITGASILRTCVVERDVLPARVNQHVAIIRAKPGISSRYIHLHLLQASTKEYLMGLNAGASREAVTKGHLESVPILNPGLRLLESFQQVTASMYAEVEQLARQSRMLAALRDTLLPKLLSGELRVPVESEHFEETA